MHSNETFEVIFGFDMETDIGSFTPYYLGVEKGTPPLLAILKKHNISATFYWTGHAADLNRETIRFVRDEGHENGCHGLFHETLGDPIFPLPNNWPVLPSEVEGRIRIATEIIEKVTGDRPVSFRCPRLWGSTQVVKVLENLGYTSDASYPLYYYRKPFTPFHPNGQDWTKQGSMKIIEIPNFCDLSMKSEDAYQRDRDQWPIFRTKSAAALMEKVVAFIEYVRAHNEKPMVCFYFHPWEFYEMPQGFLDFGECTVRPLPFIVENCGAKALQEFDNLCGLLKEQGAHFTTAKRWVEENQKLIPIQS